MRINSAKELRDYFNKEYGITKEWPTVFWVNRETYEDCLGQISDWEERNNILFQFKDYKLMFKGVQLLLKSDS